MSVGVYKWNMNEKREEVSGSRISETEMDLHLGLRRLDGSIKKVGRYRLPLLSLHTGGFVTRRDTAEGNYTFTVKIIRGSDGTYSIATRHNATPLARYAVPAAE